MNRKVLITLACLLAVVGVALCSPEADAFGRRGMRCGGRARILFRGHQRRVTRRVARRTARRLPITCHRSVAVQVSAVAPTAPPAVYAVAPQPHCANGVCRLK